MWNMTIVWLNINLHTAR